MDDYPMKEYIIGQPEALQRLLDIRKEASKVFVEKFLREKPDRLYLFGSGTSLNAAALAAPFMEKILWIEVTAVEASRITEIPLFAERPMFLAISQGGTSANTIKGIEKYKDHPMMVITSKPGSTMGTRFPELHVLLECGEEKAGPKTKGYTCTILTFYLYALEAALSAGLLSEEDYDSYIGKIRGVIERLPKNIEKTFAWFEEQKEKLKGVTTCVVFGKDEAGLLAVESSLKVLETIRIPSMHYEFEEYLHGPIMVGDEGLLLLGIVPLDEDRGRALDLLRFFREKVTPTCYAVTDRPAEGLPESLVLDMSEDKYFAVFAQTLPSQVIASELPEARGGGGFDDAYFMEIDAIVGTKDRSGNVDAPSKEEDK